MPKGQHGRPAKLTDAVQDKIVSAIRAGNYAETAAAYAGIAKTTYYRWMQQGEDGRPRYREFRDAIRAAESEAEVYAATVLRKAMPDDWKAAAWYLERKFQDRWGKRERIEHDGKLDVDIAGARDRLTRVLAGLTGRVGPGAVPGESE